MVLVNDKSSSVVGVVGCISGVVSDGIEFAIVRVLLVIGLPGSVPSDGVTIAFQSSPFVVAEEETVNP